MCISDVDAERLLENAIENESVPERVGHTGSEEQEAESFSWISREGAADDNENCSDKKTGIGAWKLGSYDPSCKQEKKKSTAENTKKENQADTENDRQKKTGRCARQCLFQSLSHLLKDTDWSAHWREWLKFQMG